ncbi:putative signal peptide protein [Puccinia sorghi]|uniref:Putative signal peptide protein n=1 Tax=Puccinia sorghi TaxID=27349 RepID=A0A0L6VA16_9BASI|nr:putative signal peptide protein [Puccinia sorghi]
MFFQPILFNIRIPTNTPRTDLLLVCWIGIICLVSSSSNAAPVFPRWPFLASDSVHVVSPATSDASKAASALQMPALNHPSPHAIADGKLGSIKPLPKKSPTPSNSISLENTARKVPSPESQENSLLFKKKPPQNNPAEQQVNTRTSFPSQKAAVKNPKPFKPKPPDKPLKFRFGSSFKDDLKRKKSCEVQVIECICFFGLASPSLWKRLKEMMENKLTVIHLFKALLRRLKLYTPRQSASAQSFSEAAHNVQKAANFKKLSSTFKSTGVMNEAKSAKADAIKPSTIETDLHHQTERNNCELEPSTT